MRNIKLTVILLVIIIFCLLGYFLMIKFSKPENAFKYPAAPLFKLSPTPSTQAQNTWCTPGQLQAAISAQGAAGNIYATLTMTNKGASSCVVILGNSITAAFEANNITINYQESVPQENFIITPGAKVYSQIHYPNGPQCQSGNTSVPVTFLYKTGQVSVVFAPDIHTGKLFINTCQSVTQKTIIDIWPLSKTPITP